MKRIVPPRTPYGIVGGGKASGHLQAYFKLLKVPYVLWRRDSGRKPETALKDCRKVFLLIKDSEIAFFISGHPFLKEKTLIHFSGALSVPGVFGVHPFVSFTNRPLTMKEYRRIPFALEAGAPPLRKLIPEFANPSFRIPKGRMALYHALCVLGGNLPVILWRKALKGLSGEFKIPKKHVLAYFRSALDNFEHDPSAALSGPLQRKDLKTINSNLKALKGDPFRKVYAAFARFYLDSGLRRNDNDRNTIGIRGIR